MGGRLRNGAEDGTHLDGGDIRAYIRMRLLELQDPEYKAFQSGLMPTIDPDTIIGVRIPALRKLARELWRGADVRLFLCDLPHAYYEENNLHAFFIGFIKDYEECVRALDAFLPYVDNWATCDIAPPGVLEKRCDDLLPRIGIWLADSHPYTVRYAIGLLMRFFLDGRFDRAYPDMVAALESGEYYVNMMRAWYFATALAKQYEEVLPYIEDRRLDPWTHNKTIQKAVESYRITPERKEYLRGLRIRGGKDLKRESVIFLDIDGVLNSNFRNDTHPCEISDGTLIDREKVVLLGQLVGRTKARVVLHSGWRFWFDGRLQPLRQEAAKLVEMLRTEGIEVYGVTPDFTTEEIRQSKRFSLVKAKEILSWVEEHPRAGKWIVLDDLDLHDETVAKHQVRTDPTIGLTLQDVKKAEKMLLDGAQESFDFIGNQGYT